MRYLTFREPSPPPGDGPPAEQRKTGPHRDFRHRRRPVPRYLVVREGGVEPPRPCGHWNLNPARLPIPPPAHWVCPRASAPCGGRCLPTSRRLARPGPWIHIAFPTRSRRGRERPRTGAGPCPSPPRPRHRPAPTGIDRAPTALRPRPPVRDRTGTTVRCGTLGGGHLYDPGQTYREVPGAQRASTTVDGADRGNQPIQRRVDTISKQYQASTTRQYDGKTRNDSDGHDGGGAPWES